MATALLAYDAKVTTSQRNALSVKQLLGDSSNGAVDNALSAGEMITAIDLPPPIANERAAYRRAIGRTHAEWPLVEVVARVVAIAPVIRDAEPKKLALLAADPHRRSFTSRANRAVTRDRAARSLGAV